MAYLFGEIEGTGFEIISSEFANCLTGHGRVERLWTGARWLEGPVWFPAGKYLVINELQHWRLFIIGLGRISEINDNVNGDIKIQISELNKILESIL